MAKKGMNLRKGAGLLLLLVFGCAAPLSQQARSQVTYTGSFSALAKEAQKFIGETTILGGKIIDVTAATEGSELTILQLPLDQNQRPVDEDRSEGRYLIRFQRFLEPEIYKKGSLITAVAKLTAVEIRAIGQFDFAYPVFQEVELKVWPKSQPSGPLFHFGVGVGAAF